MNYIELKGVPVFRPGQRRGEHYSAARLRRMVANSNRMRPYFRGVIKTKLTHAAQQPDLLNQAALGQSVRYYLKPGPGGPFVVADFAGVPEPIAQAAARHFPNVSVEKYKLFATGDGAQVPDVIKSVAFLGADAPEVKGLQLAFPEVFRDLHGDVELFQMGEPPMLGEIITKLREELALTPEDLAGAIGKTPDDVNQIEAGTLTPDEATLKAIADALGVKIEDLQPAADGSPASTPAEPAKFSESEVELRILAATQRAVAKTTRELNAKLEALLKKHQGTEAALFAERQAHKTAAIQAKIETWKTNGMPAVLETLGLPRFMAALSDQQVETFAEGGEQLTPMAWFARFIEKFQELGPVPTGELAGGTMHQPNRDNPVAEIEHYAATHQLSFAAAARELSKNGTINV